MSDHQGGKFFLVILFSFTFKNVFFLHDTEWVERHKDDIEALELKNQELLKTVHDLTQKLNQINFEKYQEEQRRTRELEELEACWELKLKTLEDDHRQEIRQVRDSLSSTTHEAWDPWLNTSLVDARQMQHAALSEISSTEELPSVENNGLRCLTPPDSALAISQLNSSASSCSVSKPISAPLSSCHHSVPRINFSQHDSQNPLDRSRTKPIERYSPTDTMYSKESHFKDQTTLQDGASLWTQTMVGDWMWKYTRSRLSVNRHKRFFWIHPYTHMLYWSTQEPGTHPRDSIKHGKTKKLP